MTDGLFNMPTFDFIYVHKVLLITVDQEDLASMGTDEDGNPVPVVQQYPQPTSAYVSAPRPSRVGRAQQIDCVVRIPPHIVVDENLSQVHVLEQDNILPNLIGVYEVQEFRPNPMDTRLALRRPKSLPNHRVIPVDDDPYGD